MKLSITTIRNKLKIKKELLTCDILIAVGFIFLLATRFVTIAFMSDIANITGEDIQRVIAIFEANPLAKWMLGLQQFTAVLTSLILPAFGIAIYIFFRNKVKDGLMGIEVLSLFCVFFCFVMLINVLNDVAYMIGRTLI